MNTIRVRKYITDKLIKNQHLLAAIVLILLLALFYRDVVFQGRTFLIETAAPGTMPYPPGGPYSYQGTKPGFVASDPGAIAWQTEPFNRFISKSLKSGDFPLWNPYAGLTGSPLFADGYTAPLEPLQFIFFFSPIHFWPYAIDLQLLIRFFIAGFGCYLFARRLKLNFGGSIAAGILFMFSSYFVVFGDHPKIKTEDLLPLVLYSYDRLADIKDDRAKWLSALFIGWAIIAGMPEATFFLLFLGTLWFFYKSFIAGKDKKTVLQKVRDIFLRYIISTSLGFLISTAYLLPFLEYVLVSKSAHAPNSTGFFFLYPLWALPNLIFQVQNSYFLQLGFFGILSLVYTLFNLRDLLEYRKNIFFFGVYAIIISLMSFDFPPTNWIRALPVFNQINFTNYSVPSVVFCLSILTGILVDSVRDHPLTYKKISLSLFIVLTIFIALPILANPSRSLSPYFIDKKVEYASIGLLMAISIALYLFPFLFKTHQEQNFSLLLIVSEPFHWRTRIKIRNSQVGNYSIQIGLLLLIISEPFFWGSRINRPDRIDPFKTPPFVSYLKNDKGPFRVFGMDGILYPNISTAYQVPDIRWLNALIPQRAYEFSTRFIAAEAEPIRMTGMNFPISDRMFDILNVKYVLGKRGVTEDLNNCPMNSNNGQNSGKQPDFGESTLDNLILQQNSNNKGLQEARLNINGSTRTAIFAHPPQEFNLELSLPQTPSSLSFSIGLDPAVFDPKNGDGVGFQIMLSDGNNEYNIFSKYIDPKKNPCDRKWFNRSVNLDQLAGKKVILKFSTNGGPIGDTSSDWAYWGSIKLTELSNPTGTANETNSATQEYGLAYQDRDVQIYQNENVYPRAFVVYNTLNVSTFNNALDLLADPKLDLRQTAVVENLPNELAALINRSDHQMQSVAASAKLISSGELNVQANTKTIGLLVVSDQYYPGWEAFVDGKSAPIYAVDGILRGVVLEKGSHMVKFIYRPLSFIIGGIISVISLLIAIVFLTFNFGPSQNYHE